MGANRVIRHESNFCLNESKAHLSCEDLCKRLASARLRVLSIIIERIMGLETTSQVGSDLGQRALDEFSGKNESP